jgi:hypothetical protein
VILIKFFKRIGFVVIVLVECSSSGGKQQTVSPPERVTMWRTSDVNLDREKPAELQMEEARLQMAKMIKEARAMADGENLLFSQRKLAKAENLLVEQSNPLLRTEIQELIKLFVTPDTYDELGHTYALSSDYRSLPMAGSVSLRGAATSRSCGSLPRQTWTSTWSRPRSSSKKRR